MRAAPSSSTANPPIAIPAMAPPESFSCAPVATAGAVVVDIVVGDVVELAEDVAEAVVVVAGTVSEGKYSPGLNIKVEFFA